MLRSRNFQSPTGGVEPVVIARREDVALRLFAFPHAGGNHTAFQDWPAGLPDDVEVVSYTLPGRGRRRAEAPYEHLTDLVDDLAAMVAQHDDGAPFAFFGHSFGALVAYEVTRKLVDLRGRCPGLLAVSAHRAPHLPPDRPAHRLPQDDFLDRVRLWGLIPDDLLHDDDLLDLVLPPLRADLRLDEEYAPQARGPLPVPCAVYGGSGDRTVAPAELAAWRDHFTSEPDHETLPGGHFYTVESRPALLAGLTRQLNRLRTAARPSVAATGAAYPAPVRSLWARFSEQAHTAPDAPALSDGPRSWTYRELRDSALDLAADLAARGTAKGDVVGLLLPHSAEYCITLLTCFAAGTPACLLEKNWPPSLLAGFLASAGVTTVVTTPDLVALLPDSHTAPERLVVLTPDRWSRRSTAEPAQLPDVAPGDTALISMTSGTSGTPKAVLNTHLGCLYCFDARYALYPYEPASRDGLNVFFAWECLRPLLEGRPAAVVPDDHVFDPVRLVGTLRQERITRIVVPPSLFESVLDHPAAGPELAHSLAHMEIVFLMGEVVPSRVVDKAAVLLPPHVRLVNAYSTWESLDVSYADLLPRPPGAAPAAPADCAPVGRVIDGTAAALLDEDGAAVPYGAVGELYVAGPGVATGYLDDPAKTAERFVPCPPALAGSAFAGHVFYRTGDRARFLPDGGLELLGRTGDIVKLRGFKVSLRSVEAALEDQEGVARVIVRPVQDPHTGQPAYLLAYVLGDDGTPSPTLLARTRSKAARDLPAYARPRHVIGLDALPFTRSDSRKLDLSALPPPPPEEPDTAGPLSTAEQRVADAWTEVLGLRTAAPDDNFFDAGGDSLSAARLTGLLAERYGIALPVVDVFQYATLRELAARCSGDPSAAAEPERPRPARQDNPRIAVVGMAGRFPGAPDINAFWQNLKDGTDSLTVFTPDELRAKGVPEEVVTHPQWVAAAQLVADADAFDAEMWGIGQREALLMDPQHRLFVEVAATAMEQAGYARRDNPYRRRTGVFAACGIDGYLIHHLDGGGLTRPLDPAGLFLTEIGNEKDYIATRVAYLLDLGGPAATVTSACSSALVAVAQAAQALASGQCDMALAGASSLNFPNFGYRYEEGLVGSPDGRVRPFDQAADGTLFGDAVGAVVLKRLEDAVADGDHVWAVLAGYGVSNDGRRKAGYTAPSARAQEQCISDAIGMAGVGSEQISYVECHATATHVGDAIEVSGLSSAFARHRAEAAGAPGAGECALGSVKGNIGHANCAAGITGFIKTVLCLHHRELVPTVHFEAVNPKLVDFIDADGSPFTVQTRHEPWSVPAGRLPRRAGVSSFGIGGTNAHVVLEEFPQRDVASPPTAGASSARPGPAVGGGLRAPFPAPLGVPSGGEGALAGGGAFQGRGELRDQPPAGRGSSPAERGSSDRSGPPGALRLVGASARSAGAVERGMGALKAVLAGRGGEETRALVREWHLTREAHPVRQAAVLDTGTGEWSTPLTGSGSGAGTVAFVFSGQGSQTAAMARGLYRGRFRRHFDAACAALGGHLGEDPGPLVLGADDTTVQRPLVTQCGLFAVEYALARTLVDLGVRPVAVAGHSIGEYAAAAISGLLTLDEAALLVAVRAGATEELADAHGGMLSVLGDEDRLAAWLAGRDGLWTAARNAPGRTVVSGTPEALRAAAVELPPLGFGCKPVPVSHPFHSPLMAPVAARLDAAAADLPVRTPDVPTASNLTGTWVDARHQPQTYWGEHVTSAVRWSEDVAALLKWAPDVILEVGPGGVLTSLTAKCLDAGADSAPRTLACMPYAADPEQDDEPALLSVLGELWCHGVDLDFAALHEDDPVGDPALRLLLPTYSFERSRYWTKPDASPYAGRAERQVPTPARPLVRHVAKPGASTRMYCFPYAGGDAAAFRSWAHAAPPWLDVVTVEPPGRGGRAELPVPADDGADMAWLDQVADAVRADAGQAAVVFCGLSFGAGLALDLLGGPLADWAGDGRVAAFCAVGRAPLGRGAAEEAQDADAYLMAPDEVRADPRWQRTVLPLLHADLAWDARTEARVAARPPVGVPLQVHCGTADPSFPPDAAPLWAAATSSPVVDVEVHPGAHDFMLHARDAILARVTAFVARLTPPPPAPAGTWDGRLHEVTWVPLPAAQGGGRRRAVGRYKGGDPRSALAFLRRELTAADREAVLVCPPPRGIGAEAYCAGWLDLLKGLAGAEARGGLTLVLPAQESSGLVAGLTRTFVLEEAGVTVRRVHVAPWPAGGVDVEAVLRRPDAHPGEQDLLLRGGHLLARRLAPAVLPELPPGTLGQVGGGYLLTGGTGGVGRAVTDWLVHHQGVRPGQVTVTGRTAPAGLREGVRFLPLDLAEPFDAGAVAAETGPLAGVFHLAGALDDGVLRNLDAARLPAVLAPKLALPRVMDLAARAGAAWVTAFSSTSSLLGAAGQANYAAANGWTDAHAGPFPDGGPQLAVVSWGTWEGTGMAAGNARAGDAARSGGETPLPAGTALALLGKVVSGLLAGAPPRHLAACDIDWPASPWAGAPLVASLPAGHARPAAPAGANAAADADAPAADGQPDALRSFLGAYVHRWDESRRLAELGLDSLDFARMRGDFARTFGKDVPLSAIARPDQRLGQLYAFLSEC
ncbi:Alpha/beta fold hydrolase [Actinacidiphila bryophytorum]|uniref:Alpha/beta fold hydrolase n=1 Tax=Actinacidiphila bryophytorum TaxID=1436133 RepID=A0A9W4E288_9ACTN|nr:Alpha/beta fold hydrolase [Actinacidiphila bryophytorum]